MNFISSLYILFLCYPFFQPINIAAEIEDLSLRWSVGLCTPECARLLQREFEKIPGVAEFSIDQPNAQAKVKWKNNVPFTFSVLNMASRLVGLAIREIHLKVTGALSHNDTSVTFTSAGDNTRFELLNPVVTEPSRQAPVNNLVARQLQPELRQKLIDAEQQKMVVTIEGQLFMPGRSSSLYLVVENLSLSAPSSTAAASSKYAETHLKTNLGVRGITIAFPVEGLPGSGKFVDFSAKRNVAGSRCIPRKKEL